MASYNRIILMGNLTRDPQLSYTPNNTAVCKFGIATNHKRKDSEGNVREDVCFLDCTVFSKGAEIFNQYMKKGNSCLVEGRLEYQQWTAQDGQKKSKHAVIVDNFQFLPGRSDGSAGSGGGDGGARYEAPAANRAPVQAAAPGGRAAPAGNSYDEPPPSSNDDIPF